MRFNKTNRVGDDEHHDVRDVSRVFMASPEYATWRRRGGDEPLERLLMRWVADTYGGWDPSEWDELADEVYTRNSLSRQQA